MRLTAKKAVAAKAIEKKADYLLALCYNHQVLFDEVSAYMDDLFPGNRLGF